MKKNHLYFGVFIIAFAANVSAMEMDEGIKEQKALEKMLTNSKNTEEVNKEEIVKKMHQKVKNLGKKQILK